MKTKDLFVYYLNPDSFTERKTAMIEFLDSLGMRYERIPSNSTAKERQIRINEGFIKLAKRAIENGVYPFLILEDDARLVTSLPEEISIPEDIEFIYWGVSLWECGGTKPLLKISQYDDEYYRLYHSLGCHAIIVPSERSAKHFIELQKLAIIKNSYSDIIMAIDSKYSLYLTPKEGPYFYQKDFHTEPITRFLWKDKLNYLK